MRALSILHDELGLHHIRDSRSPRDVGLIISQRFVRLLGCVQVSPALCSMSYATVEELPC